MNSEDYFCRLIGIDTLLSFDGIISSAADFQLKLVMLIEQFHKTMLAENESQEESEALCHALCCYLDKRLTAADKQNRLNWHRYSLVRSFYGHEENEPFVTPGILLKTLLNSESDTVFRYAWKILMLLIQVEGQTEELVMLRSVYRARYCSRPRSDTPEETPLPWISQPGTPGLPRLMVFVVGPFAGKWFKQYDLCSTTDSEIIWVVTEHANTFSKRLEHLKRSQDTVAVLAFFPLLVDGFDNNALMIEQLTSWQNAFSSISLSEPLPCLLAFYTRLSQQRYSHDPDRAIWTGKPTLAFHKTLETRLIELVDELDARDDGSDIYAIQRHALGCTLLGWLTDQRILNVLQSVFDTTQLKLAGVSLADYGTGFIRHGAWSLWLNEKYCILPGLSSSLLLPPLPAFSLPPLLLPEPTPARVSPPLPARRRWPKIAALLLLLASLGLAAGVYYYRAHLEQLKFAKEWASEDITSFFTLSDTSPLFENGSSNLMPDSEKTLQTLMPKLMRTPQQKYLIIGHSDNTGSAIVNKALSTERARVIRDWLVEHTGLPASNFMVEGAGDSRPVASNDTREGRAQNRRVEIIPIRSELNKQ